MRQSLDGVLALVVPCIRAGNLSEARGMVGRERLTARVMSAPYTSCDHTLDDASLPENSVAVIRLEGTIYAWETDWFIEDMARAEANPAVAGIVLVIDGPGGHATRIDVAASAVRNCSKPVAAVVTGTMCSAHFWIGSGAARTFAISPLCSVGSVGAMTEFVNIKKYFESIGLEVRDIYPAISDLKNEEWRELEQGGDALVCARLEKLARAFCLSVARNLGIDYDPKLEIFRGRVFQADEAVALGYIDCIGTVEDAVLWVLTEALSRKAAQLFPNNPT